MENMNLFLKKLLFLSVFIHAAAVAQKPDLRDISHGSVIYKNGYNDQPYVVTLKDKRWFCVFTTGKGIEGAGGQHIVCSTSSDHGKTWSDTIAIEPSTGPAASWVIPYLTPYGRIYAFYDYNGDNVTHLNEKPIRNDMLGWYCFKYSDDQGKTWSKRYRLPVRKTAIDFINEWNGEVQLLWGISKPITVGNNMYFGFTKMGKFISDMGEGWFFKSDNINTEREPDKLHWEMLPDGDQGLSTVELGTVQEEHNIVSLKNGDLYCMYRTQNGFPGHAYSRDGGHTWSKPEFATYTPGGQAFKTPRACPRLFKCSNGKFLFWFHNNSDPGPYNRNPAWISGGVEKDGHIYWSQPEILLYSTNTKDIMSYPDLIEEDGKFWITETQKVIARVHEIDPKLLEGLWEQATRKSAVTDNVIADASGKTLEQKIPLTALPNLKEGAFTIEIWANIKDLSPGQILLDTRKDNTGSGVWISVSRFRTLQLSISNGSVTSEWDTDRGVIRKGTLQHFVFVADGGPNIITTIVDGKLGDGGKYRRRGWGWFDEKLERVNGGNYLTVSKEFQSQIKRVRVYDRCLTTSEAIGNFNSGMR
ncbi:BNR repeat-like domain-containing protein [Siphonobacter aquaeclarae]|uniref:BNR repeat-like domain-containing protein n=2 Tax=Siphonobacter aquaeclarae TaxID=563176 RepID=A0A1G9JQW0_9BACT|nr:BNR repeat-like domain-containing protein [Siphonobacter aquaeclarae]